MSKIAQYGWYMYRIWIIEEQEKSLSKHDIQKIYKHKNSKESCFEKGSEQKEMSGNKKKNCYISVTLA